METNAARLAVVNVCELVTYDVVKELILDYRLMKDNPACHFTSAFLSGKKLLMLSVFTMQHDIFLYFLWGSEL